MEPDGALRLSARVRPGGPGLPRCRRAESAGTVHRRGDSGAAQPDIRTGRPFGTAPAAGPRSTLARRSRRCSLGTGGRWRRGSAPISPCPPPAAAGDVHLGLQSELRWRPSPAASISGSYVRSHQFSQSLRNSESVVGGIFPADLYIGAGAPGIPVARSDRVVIGAELLARAGVRLGAQAYLSAFDGVLLVAPRGGNPFATGGLRIGDGASRGLSLEAWP